MGLVPARFVLFVEVEYHQSCIDFPHRHLISWGDEQERQRMQRLEFGGERGQERRRTWAEAPTSRTPGCAKPKGAGPSAAPLMLM